MLAQQLMSKKPLSLPVDATANDALLFIHNAGVRHIPITGAKGELLGILSDRDLLELPRPQVASGVVSLKTPLNSPVSAFMGRTLFSVTAETPVQAVIDVMLEQRVDAIPVVDAKNILVGLVTTTDILKAARSLL